MKIVQIGIVFGSLFLLCACGDSKNAGEQDANVISDANGDAIQ